MLERALFVLYSVFLIVGGFFGWRAGSRISPITGRVSWILVSISASIPFVFFFLSSCTFFSSSPSPISDENAFYENEYFSIYYPKGWEVRPHLAYDAGAENATDVVATFERTTPDPIDLCHIVFYDPRFSSYYVTVHVMKISETDPFSQNLQEGYPAGEMERAAYSAQRQMRKDGYGSVSQSMSNITIGGVPAKLVKTTGTTSSGEWMQLNDFLIVKDSKYYTVVYGSVNKFSEHAQQRLESIVHSLSIK